MNKNQTFSAKGLSVNRGDRAVFENLNFHINSGELLKLVGPNGSGKSTLLKSLAGLLDLQSGTIDHNGQSVIGDTDWRSRSICYLAHKNALKNEFTVEENITFWAELWQTEDQITAAIEQMGIKLLCDTPVAYLSSGQKRRTALARSLCHPADIWLFDEPTVGLDDQGLRLLSNAMGKHMDAGGMILCATHVDLGIEEAKITRLNLDDFSVNQNTDKTELW